MKIPSEVLKEMQVKEKWELIFDIPGFKIAGDKNKFYKHLITSRCLKVVTRALPWVNEAFDKLYCNTCNDKIVKDENIMTFEMKGKHQLSPGINHAAHCSTCNIKVFEQRSPYKCNDCKLAWLLHRDVIELGQAVTIEWEDKIC